MTNLVSLNFKNRLKASIKLAQSLLKDSKYQEIIRILKDFPQEQLDDSTRILLSRAYREINEAGKALSVLSHLRADKPANQETLRLLIDIHGDLLNYERVLYFTDLLFSMERHVSTEILNLLKIYQRLGLTDRSLDLSRFLIREKMVQTSYLPILTDIVAASRDFELIRDFKAILASSTNNTKLLQQKIKRAESVRHGLRIQDVLFQRQGSLILSGYYDDEPAYACPPFPRNPQKQMQIPFSEIQEILYRLHLLIAVAGITFSSVCASESQDTELTELAAKILRLPILKQPEKGSLIISTTFSISHSHPHFSLYAPVQVKEEQGPDFIGFLTPHLEFPLLKLSPDIHPSQTSGLLLPTLLDWLKNLGASRLPRRIHRLNLPTVSIKQLHTEDPLFSHFCLLWLTAIKDPKPFELEELFLYYIKTGNPASLTISRYLDKETQLKPILLNQQKKLANEENPRVLQAFLVLCLNHLDLEELRKIASYWEEGVIRTEIFIKAGWIRHLNNFYPNFSQTLAKECLGKAPYRLLNDVLTQGYIPSLFWDHLLQKYQKQRPKSQKMLLQTLLNRPQGIPTEIVSGLQEHSKELYPELFQMMLGTDLILGENMSQAVATLPSDLRAQCISYWQLREHLQTEWDLWQLQPEKSCFLSIHGITHKNFHAKVHRFAGTRSEIQRIPLYSFLLKNYFDGMLTEIFASGILKQALADDLVRSIDNWIVKTDGETDLLFLLACQDPYYRIRLAQNLLCIGNLEGWFLLERQFLAFRSLVGVEIIKGLLNLRPDKALELFLLPDSKGLNLSQCVAAAILITSQTDYLDEWHSYAAHVRNRGLVEELQLRLEKALSKYPLAIPAFFHLFPKLSPAETLKRLGLWNQFNENQYLVLKQWDKNLASRYLQVPGLLSPVAQLILMEENA
ncbi:MAG: hypothetical protein H3C47_07080 [Candidatus Cloacimonetes bacterium]|nr:hypothetical protein [Candidatus Cloacimonadota bacterium]